MQNPKSYDITVNAEYGKNKTKKTKKQNPS